eukprot:CAMPEP_0172524156 /NCGR_PEP_ID=MMETSP1066-20121228/294040_1 /TAXON_ID=671091 /ORGANISM="Coscinodiscus wailesii, Strain CCMP2513" /LENGTH=154 /DNA_ID=CAMNT_0013307269 /DNA_START=132 /DNA_END=593 /DNA_ORIENTATION=-
MKKTICNAYKSLSGQKWDAPFILSLLVFETVLSLAIIRFVPYTEIDWVAYNEEVDGYTSGERDYMKIRGQTGPLVYPAGFLYLYSVLQYLTGGDGSDVRKGQYLFAILYVVNSAIVLVLYTMIARRLNDGDDSGRKKKTDDEPANDMSMAHSIW